MHIVELELDNINIQHAGLQDAEKPTMSWPYICEYPEPFK